MGRSGDPCRGCAYSFYTGSGYACVYILNKGKSRPCPSGVSCVVREEKNMPKRTWDVEKAIRLIEEGKNDVEIADGVGTTLEAIKAWRAKNHIRLRTPRSIRNAERETKRAEIPAKPSKPAPALRAETARVIKDDAGKLCPSLVPPELIRSVGMVREYGVQKYGDSESWRKVEPQRYWDAALRHALAAWADWAAVDPESGLPHIWHMACNLAFLIQLREEKKHDQKLSG